MLFFKRKKTSMEKEIFEQNKIVQDILDAYIWDNKNINIEIPENINRVIIVEASAVYSSEFLLKTKIADAQDLLYIFITQSGETTDTNKALEIAKSAGVKTLCITNKENSTIWNAADYKIACHAGIEQSIAATKSLTSQLLCSTILVLKFAQNKNIEVSDIIRDLNDIPSVIIQAYGLQSKIKQVAKFLSKYKNIVITADGISYALAKEASLKIKETSYINTSSYILGEFMHGHVAILNNHRGALMYISNKDLTNTAINNLNKIKENYNPAICVIGNRTNQVKTAYNLDIDCQKPLIKTFGLLVVIQMLSLEIALRLRRNVDKPHGLNKVVK